LACKKKYIPYVLHIQDIYPESLVKKIPKFLQSFVFNVLFQIEKYVVQNSSKIIVISEQMKIHFISTRKVENAKIEVVLNWQNDSDYDKYYDFIPANPNLVFMYLGNMGPVAGLPTVIKAFKAANIHAKLIIAGNGTKKEECIRLANTHPNIEFWDVPAGEVALTQSKANVLLLPMIKGAASSSIPSKLIAYMASARPIIVLADKNSYTRNTVINADCGWTGDAEDEVWLKQTFINITKISQEELLQKGNNGRSFCINNFSKEINLKKLINTILHD
jgi:glycosyltransferase involved in cell wall biosynthesis